MSYTLVIDLEMRTAALLRALATVERRSRELLEVDVHSLDDGRALVRVTVEGRLPAEVLAARLRMQYDVRSVRRILHGRDGMAASSAGASRPATSGRAARG